MSRRNPKDAIEACSGPLEHSLLPRSRFRAILGPHFEVILGSSLGPKLGPKTDTFLTSFWAPFWGPKWGPRRPRKVSRWPFDPQKGAKMSSKSLLHGSFSAPLKSYKNTVFYEVFGPPSCPKATREEPKRRSWGHLVRPERPRRQHEATQGASSEEGPKKSFKKTRKGGPETSPKWLRNEVRNRVRKWCVRACGNQWEPGQSWRAAEPRDYVSMQ